MSILASDNAEPLEHRDQLIAYFQGAEKPIADWRIGCEHEKFPYRFGTLKPVSYDEQNGLRDFMREMVTQFGWEPVLEGVNVIALTRGQSAITFEPGGQVELAGAPLATLHETYDELQLHLREANKVGEALGIGFMGIGFHPTAAREDIPWVPKGRYKIMREYMPRRGSMGLDMMLRTTTVQVNLDYASEADMVQKYRLSLALQPIATALFATSPFAEGKVSGAQSGRMRVWTDTDPDRSGAPVFVYEDGFGYERYIDYALDVPMYFIYRDGRYIDCAGQSFRAFMEGKLPGLPNMYPTMMDWANHLTTLFPDVRLKKILEMRGADAGPASLLQALPAFWTGILYDSEARAAAWDVVKGWSDETRAVLINDAWRLGLHAEIGTRKLHEVALEILEIARGGLSRRARMHKNQDETCYLDVLFEMTLRGESRADQLLGRFKEFDAAKLFEICRL